MPAAQCRAAASIGSHCGAHTFPYVDTARSDAVIEHEATTTRISEERLFYCQQRGIDPHRLNPAFGLPRDRSEWGFLITLLPSFPRWNAPVPVANALSIEVGFYLLMPGLLLVPVHLGWPSLQALHSCFPKG